MGENKEEVIWDSDIDLILISFKLSIVLGFLWVIIDILSRVVIQI